MVHLLLALIVATSTQATAQTAVLAPVQPVATTSPIYQVGPADVLNIKVLDEPGLTNLYAVDSDGSITFPFLQRVDVGGKTVREIETLLTKALVPDWLNKPQVSVEIEKFRSRRIYVLGEVRTPGTYNIEGPMTLLEVIARAGSFTAAAGPEIIVQRYKDGIAAAVVSGPVLPDDPRGATVLRVNIEALREGRLSTNILLQDSDTIVIPEADRFYVTGFVKTPGFFVLKPNMSVRQAIAVAGGLTERGSSRGLIIIRKVKDKNGVVRDTEVKVKMTDLVRPNDTIQVRQRLI